MMKVTMYTDGSARGNPDGPGGYGTILEYIDPKGQLHVKEISKGYKKTTNNRMEIGAVLLTLSCFNAKVDSITIYTDSMYVIGCATLGWKRKKNKALWDQFDKEYQRVSKLCSNITFQHVKGHAENKWNNYVDKLAVSASHELL